MKILTILASFLWCGSAFATPLHTGDLGSLAIPQIEMTACTAAGPQEYLRICERFTSQNGAAECLAIGNGTYFTSCGLDLCHRFTSESGALSCLRAISNKDYTVEEANICGRFTTESGALQCLTSSGTPHDDGGDGDGTIADVRLLILDALDFIEQERYNRAEDSLHEALDRIDFGPHP